MFTTDPLVFCGVLQSASVVWRCPTASMPRRRLLPGPFGRLLIGLPAYKLLNRSEQAA